MEAVQLGDVVAIDVINDTFFVHLYQLAVNGIYQFAVITNVAILTRGKRQVLCRKVGQVQFVNMVFRLITEADNSIVLTCRQVLQGFGQVAHHVEHSTSLGQCVRDGTTGHIGYLLPFYLTHVKLISILSVVAENYLIVELEDSA